MERPIIMVNHGVVAGGILYVILRFILKQPALVAEKRAVLFMCAAVIYMVLFGHKLPSL